MVTFADVRRDHRFVISRIDTQEILKFRHEAWDFAHQARAVMNCLLAFRAAREGPGAKVPAVSRQRPGTGGLSRSEGQKTEKCYGAHARIFDTSR
jgi:hypothetical protein